MLPLFKILTPKVLKGIMNYVFDKNPLDHQMEAVLNRLERLEKDSHPKRDFVLCNQCKQTIRNYEGTD